MLNHPDSLVNAVYATLELLSKFGLGYHVKSTPTYSLPYSYLCPQRSRFEIDGAMGISRAEAHENCHQIIIKLSRCR